MASSPKRRAAAAASNDSRRSSAKCKSRFRIFAIFPEQTGASGLRETQSGEQKTKSKKKRERERTDCTESEGCEGMDAILRNNGAHIVTVAGRYCFTLQNIAFCLRCGCHWKFTGLGGAMDAMTSTLSRKTKINHENLFSDWLFDLTINK